MTPASSGEHDLFVGAWSPVDASVRASEITKLVIRETERGYEATVVLPDGRVSSVQLRRQRAGLLMTIVPPIHGGFALHWRADTERLELVESGGTARIDFLRVAESTDLP
jgi:hypothetical protein